MPYISGGEIGSSRPWSMNKISDAFWAFIFGVLFFFKTLLPINPFQSSTSDSRSSNGRTRMSAAPGRRIGGLPRNSGVSAPPCGAGGG